MKLKFKPAGREGKGTIIDIMREAWVEENNLHPVISGLSWKMDRTVNKAAINITQLEKIIHEWKLFKKARKLVEIDVLDFFVKSPHDTLAVSEIKKQVKASDASIHKALNNLVKKGLLTKPGKGTYRRRFSI